MIYNFWCSVSALTLTWAIAAISANAYPDSVTGSASAGVVAPGTIGSTFMTFSTGAFISGATGDLVVHVPGVSLSWAEGGYVSIVASALLAGLNESCFQNGGRGADCFTPRAEDGMLKGNPIVSLTLDIADGLRPGSTDVSVTVVYN